MNSIIRNAMAVLLLILGSTPALYAQYNPTNPPEPQENIYYNVTVESSPAAAANMTGTGKYVAGTNVDVRYSLKSSVYSFSHWTVNGERTDIEKSSFTHTVTGDTKIVAHFKYTPSSPLEPNSKDEYKLFIEASNEGACSFNRTSGLWTEFDNYVTLTTYVNQGYDFLGWYRNGVLVSDKTTFNYLMPAEDVTLVAKFRYNPFNPTEPEGDGSQSNVQTHAKGDVNKDGVVNVFDIVSIVNYSLGESDENLPTYDITGDGVVNVFDIVRIVNLSLE